MGVGGGEGEYGAENTAKCTSVLPWFGLKANDIPPCELPFEKLLSEKKATREYRPARQVTPRTALISLLFLMTLSTLDCLYVC